MPRKNSLTKRRRILAEDHSLDTRVTYYTRVSTDKQENSLDAQRRTGEAFAAGRSLIIDQTIVDEDSSAVKTNFLERRKVIEMLRTMKQRNIRTILILRADRVFRSILDYAQSIKWLRENSYSIRFIDPDLDLDSPAGEMMAQILVSFAQMECRLREKRVDDALDSMRSRRITRNHAPSYGWAVTDEVAKLSKAGKEMHYLTPIQSEQTILRHIIHLWDTTEKKHGALSNIARELNALKIPTKMAGQTMKRHGVIHTCTGNWTAAAVKSVLESAVPATPEELENPDQTLQQAIESLTKKSLAA